MSEQSPQKTPLQMQARSAYLAKTKARCADDGRASRSSIYAGFLYLLAMVNLLTASHRNAQHADFSVVQMGFAYFMMFFLGSTALAIYARFVSPRRRMRWMASAVLLLNLLFLGLIVWGMTKS